MPKYNYKLTEEFARWAFEIICKKSDSWFIAFTNPTAGPWKVIKGKDSDGKLGEVYRFDLEETRPDIVIVNDNLKLVIIIEAKDSLTKLLTMNQPEKSVEVVANLYDKLSGLGKSPFWGNRSQYTVLTGLLWGNQEYSTTKERNRLFDKYQSEISKYPQLNGNILIGIETLKDAKTDGLSCVMYSKSYQNKGLGTISPAAIAQSLNLTLLK